MRKGERGTRELFRIFGVLRLNNTFYFKIVLLTSLFTLICSCPSIITNQWLNDDNLDLINNSRDKLRETNKSLEREYSNLLQQIILERDKKYIENNNKSIEQNFQYTEKGMRIPCIPRIPRIPCIPAYHFQYLPFFFLFLYLNKSYKLIQKISKY